MQREMEPGLLRPLRFSSLQADVILLAKASQLGVGFTQPHIPWTPDPLPLKIQC
jgi:hypothetical protein